MDREELLSKVVTYLGSTKLTLSDETINGELDDGLSELGDAPCDDAFVSRLGDRLRRMDGNLHRDVSDEVRKWKSLRKDRVVSRSKSDDSDRDQSVPVVSGQPALTDELRMLREELNALRQSGEEQRMEYVRSAVLRSVEDGLRSRLSERGIGVNGYILSHALRELSVNDDAQVGDLIPRLEELYYRHLRDAGLSPVSLSGVPVTGVVSSGGSTHVDSYFRRKSIKEGWSLKQ